MRLLRRMLDSPTLTSWLSFAVRTLTIPITLPLFLRLDPREVAVWFMITTLTSFSTIADVGFSHTFYRLIAFATAGARRDALLAKSNAINNPSSDNPPDLEMLADIFSIMVYVYAFLSAIFFVGLVVGGATAVYPLIEALSNPGEVWFAAGVVAVGTTASFLGSVLFVYLQGTNRIAEVRRWDAAILFLNAVVLATLLIAGFRVGALLIASQIGILLGIVRNYYLCRASLRGLFQHGRFLRFDGPLFRAALAPSWRSGIGVFASLGSARLCVVLLSRAVPPEAAAVLLLSIQILDQISTFSTVPFYVKLPRFSVLRFQGNRDVLIRETQRGMFLSHLCFIAPGIVLALTAEPLLRLIGSHVSFIGMRPWSLLLLGYWLMRYGAMHIQLYSTTNHIIWHYANGLSAAVLIAVFALTVNRTGVYSLGIAYVLAYGIVYTPIAVFYSLSNLKIGFWRFERLNLPLAGILIGFVAIVFAS